MGVLDMGWDGHWYAYDKWGYWPGIIDNGLFDTMNELSVE